MIHSRLVSESSCQGDPLLLECLGSGAYPLGSGGRRSDRIRNHNSNMWSGCYWWHIVATAISSFFSFLRNEGAAAREVRASTREVSSVNPTGTLFHPNRVYLGDLTAVDREKSWSSVEMGPVMLQLLLI